MLKKPTWRLIGIALAWVLSLSGLVVLMGFVELKKNNVLCTDVKIYIPGNQYFIDKDEVENILELKNNDLIGRKLSDINTHQLVTKLKANPFVEYAKVYEDMDGVINVIITQRQPVLRIINKFNQDFYLDRNGFKIPLSDNYTARVLVANGNIDEPMSTGMDTLSTALGRDLFATANFIRKDSLWNAQIVQLYVNKDHEMELIPRVGDHRILLGNADSLQLKFRNLLVFYQQALPKVGQDAYKIINIKYANQVIGIKNLTAADSAHLAAIAAKADTVKHKNSTTQITH